MPGKSDFMDVFEAADYLGVHVQTLRRLARQKKIPAFKVGRDWRFDEKSLSRWMDGQNEQTEKAEVEVSGVSVAVVDDEEKVCKAIVRMLNSFGCQAQYSTSGAIGLDMVLENPPDLILLDLMMPDINGPRFLSILRKSYPNLPVVIVTGYPESDLMREASQFAPVMLLAKPVESDQLKRTLDLVLGARTNKIYVGGG